MSKKINKQQQIELRDSCCDLIRKTKETLENFSDVIFADQSDYGQKNRTEYFKQCLIITLRAVNQIDRMASEIRNEALDEIDNLKQKQHTDCQQ